MSWTECTKCKRRYLNSPAGKEKHELSRWHEKSIETGEAKKELRELLDRLGRKVYCKVAHVSRSGMYRLIDFYVMTSVGGPININRRMAIILDRKLKNDSLECHGCGMDMGFEAVYSLGRALWPHGDGKTMSGRNGTRNRRRTGAP